MAGPYDSLLADLDQQLDRTARFVPMAFHVHSPESFDWAQRAVADAAKNDRARLLNDPAGVREYLDSLAAEFSIVCVTDHMKSAYACRLAEEARPREDITVFPGVELNCVGQLGSSRIHLLAVFPPEANPTTIDRVCAVHTPGRFPAEAERQGQEELQVDSLKALAQAIHHEGGLFILAHIDEHQRGHRACFRVLREESLGFVRTAVGSDAPLEVQQQVSVEYTSYVNDLAPDAIEIMHPEDRHHYVVVDVAGQRQRIPCVIRSDHHSVEELGRAEAKTYVKVARHDFASVREALRFFETRVRYRDDLPTTPSPRLVGLRLRSPSRAGLFEDATLAFNPNLNCVIGSRGSGKSTIIEALRYALGLNGALIELPAAGNGQVNFAEIALRTQRANLKDTLIEVVYEIEGARYVLSSTYDAEADVTTATFNLDGSERKIAAEALPVEFGSAVQLERDRDARPRA